MQADRFTIKSREALEAANALARERRNPQLTPEHLLAVLLEQSAEGGVVLPVLGKLGAPVPSIRAAVNAALETLPTLGGEDTTEPTLSRELAGVLSDAEKQAGKLSDQYISTEHLLVALAAEKGAAGQ